MSGSNSAERKRYEPLVLVETADLSEEDWLDYRRRGIGGSDVSAIFGTSPFRTARDLYYDKLNIASVEDDEGNWVAMEMGHLLEPLVAKIFERKTGYRVYQIKKMFQHPQYPWMLADVDYFVELPDGTTAILEIKTTNYNARDNWWMNGKETVPVYYESQGRHYMAVGYGLIKVFVFDPHTVKYQKAGIGGSGFTDVLPQGIKWFFVLGFQHLHGYDLQIAPQGFQMVH